MNEKIGSQLTLLKRCCLDFQFELCLFILSCFFRMVTVQKVTKRSINTQVHYHSEKKKTTNFSHFHSVNNALRQTLVHYFSAFKAVHSKSTQHSLVRWTDRLECYFYLCENHCILGGRRSVFHKHQEWRRNLS